MAVVPPLFSQCAYAIETCNTARKKMLLVLPLFSLDYGTRPQDHSFSHSPLYTVAEKFGTIASMSEKGIYKNTQHQYKQCF